ncbi:MAG TPA: C1 family peptidase [Chitinophagaceae bacterium]|nr:C1 family peptidase [Chitinophagaceae bacterium]
MKRILFILIALLTSLSGFSQGFKQSEFYIQRELKASPALRAKLSQLRQEIASKNLQYTVGFTSVAEIPIEKITGAKPITPAEEVKVIEQFKVNTEASRIKNATIAPQQKIVKIPVNEIKFVYGNPTLSKLDLRKGGFVTPVRDQGYWGSCWAFSAMAAYESSYKIIFGTAENTSEEYVVNCSNSGGWDGGWPYKVMYWMTSQQKNVCDESSLPYTGPPQICPGQAPMNKYYASTYGAVDPAKFSAVPDVAKIKAALCTYGVISTTLYADDNFKHYTGGYFFGFKSSTGSYAPINHAVAIIGWDDSIQCWLIKNSWGTDWGTECGYNLERGYMWIKYDSNNIGVQSVWVRASNQSVPQ